MGQALPLSVSADAPAESGVVTRSEAINGFQVQDYESGLWSTIGFDREGWCMDGAPSGPGALLPYLSTLHIQEANGPGKGDSFNTAVEGILTVTDGPWSDCNNPAIGVGVGQARRTNPAGPVINLSWHGTIITPTGETLHVSVQLHTQQGTGATIRITP